MYNVALNIKAPSTRIWVFLKLDIFFITKRPSLNTKPVNPLSHPWPIHVKNMWFQKIFGFVWTGAINWYLKDLVTVPLICWLSSALIYLQQKEISHLLITSLEVYINASVVLTLRVRLIGKSRFRF